MTLALRYAAHTDVGLGPKTWNEDSGYAGPHLLAIADGMGGTVGGDVASSITISTVRALDTPGHADPRRDLGRAAVDANARIAARIKTDPHLEGMGTTLTVILFDDDVATVAHIGDSRAYLLRGNRLEMITKDHTFVQSLVDEGRITPEEAEHHPHRSLILRALEGRQEARPDLSRLDLQPGDRLLVCSDGLDNAAVKDDMIAEVLIRSATPDDAGAALIALALERGSPDNVTCVVADVVETDRGGPGPGEALVVGAAGQPDRTYDDNPATSEHAPLDGSGAPTSRPAPDAFLGDDHEPDFEEELRYAPRPPRRFRWLTRLIGLAVVLGLLVVGGRYAYDWTQRQYYVGAYPAAQTDAPTKGRVAIFRGIAQQIPGISLSDVYELKSLELSTLPLYHRERIAATIPADNLRQARSIVAMLSDLARRCAPTPTPTPTPTPRPTPSGTKKAGTPDRPADGAAAPSPGATRSPSATPGQPTTPQVAPECAGAGPTAEPTGTK